MVNFCKVYLSTAHDVGSERVKVGGLCCQKHRQNATEPEYVVGPTYMTSPYVNYSFALNGGNVPPYLRLFLTYDDEALPEYNVVRPQDNDSYDGSWLFGPLSNGAFYKACVQPMMNESDTSLPIYCSDTWAVNTASAFT